MIDRLPLRQRLIDDNSMRRFTPETRRNYLRDVGRLATWRIGTVGKEEEHNF